MQQSEQNLSTWLFIYALSYAVLHILPALIPGEIIYKFKLGDALDLFTPFIMLYLVYELYSKTHGAVTFNQYSKYVLLVIIFGSIAFVEGHGMHLAANAIFRHIESVGTPIYKLTYFFDETLGHILWDGGLLLVAVGLILSSRNEQGVLFGRDVLLLAVAAVLYGFTYFVNAVEGQTVVFTFPAAVLLPVLLYLDASKTRVALFFLTAFLISDLLFVVWWIWQGGFPQFSELGWI